jgi:DNA-directed RNA polymerase subunit RPC12/RpoP
MTCMTCGREVDTLIHHDPIPEYPVNEINCPLDVCTDCEQAALITARKFRALLYPEQER